MSWPHDPPLTSKKTRSLGALLTIHTTYRRQWIQRNRLIALRPYVGLKDSKKIQMYNINSKKENPCRLFRILPHQRISTTLQLFRLFGCMENKCGTENGRDKKQNRKHTQPHEKYFFQVAMHCSICEQSADDFTITYGIG